METAAPISYVLLTPELTKLVREVQISNHFCRRSRFVHRVEVQSGRTFAQQLFALSCGIFDPKLCDRVVVLAAPVELVQKRFRQIGAAQGNDSLDLGSTEDRHDTRHERYGY